MDHTNKPISDKLKHYRAASALSQQQVADALRVERSTYGKYETGVTEPGLSSLVKLAHIFNVSPLELLPALPDEEQSRSGMKDRSRINDPIYQLSKDERGLIALYRVLSREDKQLAREFVGNLSKNDSDIPIK